MIRGLSVYLAVITIIFIVSIAPSVWAPLASFAGTVVINGTNSTANGAPVSAHINNSNTAVITREVGAEGAASGKFIIDLFCQATENITFRVYNITANGSTPQTCPTSASPITGMTLYFNKTGNGGTCYYNLGCTGGFCVHNICRNASTFCGDGFCDSGESRSTCAADCPAAPTTPETPGSGGAAQNQSKEKNVSKKPELVPGIGLINNTKLQEAIEKVLAKGKLSEQARQNLLRISESITSSVELTRNLNIDTASTLTTTIKYKGSKIAKNFIVYEKLPKTFASNANKITVIASGATIEVVVSDPEYIIKFDEVNPNQELLITYRVSDTSINTSVINDVYSEIYAESLESVEQPPAQICTAGELRCSGDNLEVCSQDGTAWAVMETCQYGCENNACKQPPEKPVDYSGIILLVIVVVIIVLIISYFAYNTTRKKSRIPQLKK